MSIAVYFAVAMICILFAAMSLIGLQPKQQRREPELQLPVQSDNPMAATNEDRGSNPGLVYTLST